MDYGRVEIAKNRVSPIMIPVKARMTVIDTDPGIDDAIAILLALVSPEFDIRGLVTVAGNIGIGTTTRNAGGILALAERSDIPVVVGASSPLSRSPPEPLELHGADGIGGVALPAPMRQPVRTPATEWLSDLLLAHPPGTVEVFALGPLTNLARLVIERPDAAMRIGRIVAMGGTIHEPGNVGPRTEFNIAADPESADVVLRSGISLILIPLDVTRRVRATRFFVDALAASGSPIAGTVANLIATYFTSATDRESRPLHDPSVILFALRPDLFELKTLRLGVDTGTDEDAGFLTTDRLEAHLVQVAMSVDAPAVLHVLKQHLSAERG